MVRQKPAKLPFPSSNLGATFFLFNPLGTSLLYLVATPIGNLKDITYRAIEVLKACDYVLCEDTRHTRILMNHYAISKPLKSYHKFNEAAKENIILEDLQAGKTIALVSDAGTPGISDPGTRIVEACIKNGIKVSPIPGPCAAIAALCSSGFSTDRFEFFGFLPRKAGELKQALKTMLSRTHTTICYESPHRLQKLLEEIALLDPERKMTLGREITKKYEEIVQGTAKELLLKWEKSVVKGEIAILIEAQSAEEDEKWDILPLKEHVDYIQNTHAISRMEAIKIAASQRGITKKEAYKSLHEH